MTETPDTATPVDTGDERDPQHPEGDAGVSTTTDTPGDEQSQDTDGPAEHAEHGGEPQDGKGSREAKFRKELRAEKDAHAATTERLTRLQRVETERLASQHLADGADVWRDGLELADVLNDDGDVDPAKVTAAAQALGEQHRHWRKLTPAAPPASTVTSNDKIEAGRTPPSWADVLKGRVAETR